jgi:Fe-S cluster assembly ATPase SufC
VRARKKTTKTTIQQEKLTRTTRTKQKKQTNNRQKQQTDKNNQTTRTTKQQYSHVAYLFSAGSKKRSELSVNVVSAPCGLILEFLNLEKMQHVMQKK